jgi:maltooligosyltrehalose trehalohydrolase
VLATNEETGSVSRRLPVGAEVTGENTEFRVWAPGHDRIEVVTDRGAADLQREAGGYFRGTVSGTGAGARYAYRLDGKDEFPDPASRFQPDGPHGRSEVVDPSVFRWTDGGWRGVPLERAVIYEMHIGTFTPEGTWKAAIRELPSLRDVGITVLEVMPVADFSGRFGWGYDGVNLFAPTRLYGRPDEFRRFVDRAHSLGIAVILDVVYNHVGTDGNYLGEFTGHYFSRKYTTDWGDAINFDGPESGPVREFFVANARYWIDEFHLDGLRLDATQNIYDESERHILADITEAVRSAAQDRVALVVAENEPQQTRLVRPPRRGGYGMDALWNDDFHHSAVVALTGRNEAYYTDYLGTAAEFVAAAKHGYLYQGQYYKWQKKRRGTSTAGIGPSAFVTFIENHDQVANSAWGERMSRRAEPALLRAMTALVLLGPGTPMLFQGQEFGSSRRFFYFADVPDDLGKLVREGRKEFLSQWRSIRTPEMLSCLSDPCSEATFAESKLDHGERKSNSRIYGFHTDLLKLRREDPVLSSWSSLRYDGAALSGGAFVLRAFSEEHGDRLLVFNFGRDLHFDPAPEPLLAPPDDMVWEILFSTEHPRYGGCGTAPVDTDENWRIPGHAALVMRPVGGREEKRE